MSIRIPVVAPGLPYLAHRAAFDAAVARVLEGGWYILGPETREFEQAFAAFTGIPQMIGVGNGTDAIVIALRTLGLERPKDVVLTVSHTAVATVAAIELAGATPVLVDIDPVSYTIDPAKLEDSVRALKAEGLQPRAVIGVHLYGQPCDLPALVDICTRHDLLLIEDCAQAHGARFAGQHVGTTGDAATFSFYPTKNLGAFGDGGAVGFNDATLAERCRALREYGWHERYISDIPGMNSRLDELHAAMLSVRLEMLDDEVTRRRMIAALYDAGLAGTVGTPSVRAGAEHAYHLYVIRSPRRDALKAALEQEGIGTGIHYPVPVHLQRGYSRLRTGAGGMETTETASREILSLPMHGYLSDRDAGEVVHAISRHTQAA